MVDGLVFYTEDLLRWGAAGGAGTGGLLTGLQVDENFWTVHTRILALEENPPEAVSIQSFTVVGSLLEINLTDGSTQGPFTLPIAMLEDKGIWTNDLALFNLNIITVEDGADAGMYFVKIAHTTPASPATFDPDAIDEDSGSPTFGEKLYQLIFKFATVGGGGGSGTSNEFIVHIPGIPGDGMASGDPIWWMTVGHEMVLPTTFSGDPGDFTGWVAANWYQSMAGDGTIQFDVNLNGVRIVTIEFLEGAGYATILREDADPHPLHVGDTLSINTTTGTPTTNMKNITITMKFDAAA